VLGILVAMLMSGRTKLAPPPKSRESKTEVPVGGGEGASTMERGHGGVGPVVGPKPKDGTVWIDPPRVGPDTPPREPDRPRERSVPREPRTPTGTGGASWLTSMTTAFPMAATRARCARPTCSPST